MPENVVRTPIFSDRVLLYIFCVGLACRFLFALLRVPHPWPDSKIYIASGSMLLHTGRTTADNVMPLYPLFLALLGKWLIPVQVLLSAGLVFTVYHLAQSVFESRRVAQYAAFLIALDPITIYYADQQLTETLYTFLLCSALLLFYRSAFAWASVAFVLSVLVRPTLDPLGPVLVVLCSVFGTQRVSVGLIARRLVLYAATYVALMCPGWWHNYQKYGRFVRLNLGDGVVLRVEHNPAFPQTGFDWDHLRPFMTEYDAVPNPIRRNELYRRAAIEYIVGHPGQCLVFLIRRFGRFWSPVIDQGEHHASWALRVYSVTANS